MRAKIQSEKEENKNERKETVCEGERVTKTKKCQHKNQNSHLRGLKVAYSWVKLKCHGPRTQI